MDYIYILHYECLFTFKYLKIFQLPKHAFLNLENIPDS